MKPAPFQAPASSLISVLRGHLCTAIVADYNAFVTSPDPSQTSVWTTTTDDH